MKKIALACLLLALALGMTACAQTPAAPAKTCAEIADAVQAGQSFQELTALETDLAATYVDLDADTLDDLVMRMDASRATPEMIIVLTAKDQDALTAAREALTFYRDNTTEQYRDYRPEELPKLENAVLETKGLMAALIVGPDAAGAKDALNTAWK